jgi:hypothetical protein
MAIVLFSFRQSALGESLDIFRQSVHKGCGPPCCPPNFSNALACFNKAWGAYCLPDNGPQPVGLFSMASLVFLLCHVAFACRVKSVIRHSDLGYFEVNPWNSFRAARIVLLKKLCRFIIHCFFRVHFFLEREVPAVEEQFPLWQSSRRRRWFLGLSVSALPLA